MAEKQSMPPLGDYPFFEVLSALRKSIKLDLPEEAIYWLTVLLEYGGRQGPKTAARQLWVVACEDVDDPAIVQRAFAVFQMTGQVPETDALYFLTAAMCRAQKWWQTPEGQLVDHWWAKALGDLKRAPKPIPVYALDRHTRRGWERFRSGRGFDDRFSGTDVGRAKTLWLFTRHGRLHPDDQVGPEFRAFWEDRRELQAMGERGVDEPPEFPPPPCLLNEDGAAT